jgi:hypothetical protein
MKVAGLDILRRDAGWRNYSTHGHVWLLLRVTRYYISNFYIDNQGPIG